MREFTVLQKAYPQRRIQNPILSLLGIYFNTWNYLYY